MPPPRTGDLSASLVVLGLLVERPDTVAGVRIRLADRFPHAHWSRQTVDNNLPSLVKQKHARLVREGHKPGLNRYEATAEGVAHFRGWVRGTTMPPALRDTLHGKLSFSTRDDLLVRIETIRQEEKAYRDLYAAAHKRSREMRRLQHRSVGGETDWDAIWQGVLVGDEAKWWGLNVERLQELLEVLEGVFERLPASRAMRRAG